VRSAQEGGNDKRYFGKAGQRSFNWELDVKIFKELLTELSALGLKLFRAECLNGTHNIVIACAGSKEEAADYFAEYGKVLKCSQLMMPM